MLRGETSYSFDVHTDDVTHVMLSCYILLWSVLVSLRYFIIR